MSRLTQLITTFYKRILGLSLLLALIAIFFTSKLMVSSDFEKMLPKDSPTLLAAERFSDYFPAQDQGIVVLQAEKAKALTVMTEMAQEMLNQEYIREVFYTIDFSSMGQSALLYVDPSEKTEGDGFYFTNDEENVFVMFVKPAMTSGDFVKDRESFYLAVTEIIGLYSDRYGIDIGLTGGAFIQDYEADTVAFSGMGPKVLLTLALIILLVMAVFKRVFIPMLTIYPLILGALFAGAFAYLFYGAINMFSVSFAMLLLGLGIDFGIHLLVRIFETPMSTEEAVAYSLKTTGQSILIGALTTGIAFMAFAFAKFKAFEQMGVISGVGVLLLAVTMIVVLPALILLFKKNDTKGLADTKWLIHILRFVIRKRLLLFLLLISFLLVLVIPLSQTHVVGDMDKIYPENMPAKDYASIVEDALSYNVDTLTLMIEKNEESLEIIDELEALDAVKEVISIYSFLPENQKEKIEIYKSIGMDLTLVTIDDLPEVLSAKYTSKDKMMVEIVPNFNVYKQEAYEEFVQDTLKITGEQPTGIAPLMNEIIALSTQDIVNISFLCFVMIFILLMVMFRSFKKALMTISPILLTVYTCLGVMPVIHCDINIFSIAAFPLILGIGIDSSIHLMHRLDETKDLSKIANTSQAIFVTAMTTVIGFGSLGLINHPGMANLGIAVALGMGINFLYTLLIIPNFVLKKTDIK